MNFLGLQSSEISAFRGVGNPKWSAFAAYLIGTGIVCSLIGEEILLGKIFKSSPVSSIVSPFNGLISLTSAVEWYH
jgi:hypothetical protein